MASMISRRRLLGAGAAFGVGAAVTGALGVRAFDASAASTTCARSGIAHPGMLHSAADFARMKTKVKSGVQPWLDGWNKLTANAHSASSWKPDPQTTIVRGGTGRQNYGTLYNDIAAAYQNALRWKISGIDAHGQAAADILNAWSGKLTTITGSSDRFLAAGIYGYQFANAAEIMRDHSGFDLARFQSMMLDVFYPANDDFLKHHNGACVTHYWANWDLCNMCSVLAIGILCDDRAKVDQAITYFTSGAGNGSIRHVTPYVYPGGLAQWQESGRDQGHTTLGVALMGAFCQMAWNQGHDLFGYDDNRFLKACEYIAKYNLGNSVPFTTYTWGSGVKDCSTSTQTVISEGGRGNARPAWELVYNHYAVLKGLAAPYTKQYADKMRPEGGGGDYGPNSGGYDQLGFGTLTYTR